MLGDVEPGVDDGVVEVLCVEVVTEDVGGGNEGVVEGFCVEDIAEVFNLYWRHSTSMLIRFSYSSFLTSSFRLSAVGTKRLRLVFATSGFSHPSEISLSCRIFTSSWYLASSRWAWLS